MKKTKRHFTFQERVMLSDLLNSNCIKKSNGKPHISKIAKIMHKSRNTIMREIARIIIIMMLN